MNRFLFTSALLCAILLMAKVFNPAEYGFSPDATPAENAVALQKALEGGNRKVVIDEPGVYNLGATVYLDDDTILECVPGVVLRKEGRFEHILVNRGAYNYYTNKNITLRGVHISIGDAPTVVGSPNGNCPGVRGQITFCRVQNVQVYDFLCHDMSGYQYCIQFCDFDGLIMDGFDIRGDKDGVHLNRGRNFVIRNGVLCTADDGIALNAGDWTVDCTPLMGSIEDGLVENIQDLPGGKCNFARLISGCWMDWHDGMKLMRGDIFRHGKNVYSVYMPLGLTQYVSHTPPTHTHGLWESPEGIKFLFLQDDGETRADIRNVVFQNIYLHAERGFSCSWEICEYSRLIHPDVPQKDYPVIDVTLDGVFADSHTPVFRGIASGTIRMHNVISKHSPLFQLNALHHDVLGSFPTERNILITGGDFRTNDGIPADIILLDPKGTAHVTLEGNLQSRPVIIQSNSNITVDGTTKVIQK